MIQKTVLKPQHQLFVDAYLKNGFNQTAAAKSAGYKDSACGGTGSILLKRSDIQAAIDEHFDEIKDKNDKLFNHLTNLLTAITSVTIDQYIQKFNPTTKEITWKAFAKWTPAMKKACSGMKWDARGNLVIELHGKQWAADMIAKHIAYYQNGQDDDKGRQLQNNILVYMPDNKRGKVETFNEVMDEAKKEV